MLTKENVEEIRSLMHVLRNEFPGFFGELCNTLESRPPEQFARELQAVVLTAALYRSFDSDWQLMLYIMGKRSPVLAYQLGGLFYRHRPAQVAACILALAETWEAEAEGVSGNA